MIFHVDLKPLSGKHCPIENFYMSLANNVEFFFSSFSIFFGQQVMRKIDTSCTSNKRTVKITVHASDSADIDFFGTCSLALGVIAAVTEPFCVHLCQHHAHARVALDLSLR